MILAYTFQVFYVASAITSWTWQKKKQPPNPFEAALLASDNINVFPPYWESLLLYLNKQELLTFLDFFFPE